MNQNVTVVSRRPWLSHGESHLMLFSACAKLTKHALKTPCHEIMIAVVSSPLCCQTESLFSLANKLWSPVLPSFQAACPQPIREIIPEKTICNIITYSTCDFGYIHLIQPVQGMVQMNKSEKVSPSSCWSDRHTGNSGQSWIQPCRSFSRRWIHSLWICLQETKEKCS